MKASFGDEVSPFRVKTLKLAEGQRVIISIASKNIVVAKQHYIVDVGYIQCFEGRCCKDCGIPSVKYGIPVYVYPVTYQAGQKVPQVVDGVPELHMLSRGYTDYQNLKTKSEILSAQGMAISDVKILVTCVEQKYQNFEFDILDKADWKARVGKVRYKEDMLVFMEHAEECFGRPVDELAYLKLLSQATTQKPAVDRPSLGNQPVAVSSRQMLATSSAPASVSAQSTQVVEAEVISDQDFEDILADM